MGTFNSGIFEFNHKFRLKTVVNYFLSATS